VYYNWINLLSTQLQYRVSVSTLVPIDIDFGDSDCEGLKLGPHSRNFINHMEIMKSLIYLLKSGL